MGVVTHGLTKTRAFNCWNSMMHRCYSQHSKSFKNYGGRGIIVCDSWHKVENFYKDMGDPALGLTLDRIDVNGNYEPSNCHWATKRQQIRNRRNTVFLTICCQTKTLAQWCEEFNKPIPVINGRLKRGWDPIKALTFPLNYSYKGCNALKKSSLDYTLNI